MALPLIHPQEGIVAVSTRPELTVLPGGEEIVNGLVAKVYKDLMHRLQQTEGHMYDSNGGLNPGTLLDNE